MTIKNMRDVIMDLYFPFAKEVAFTYKSMKQLLAGTAM
jgi:hypothetical protein